MTESVVRRLYGKGKSRKIASLIRNNPQIVGMWCCIFATERGFPATSVRFYAAKENSSWQGFLSYWYYIRKNSLWWNGVGWGRKAWCKNATLKKSILWKKVFLKWPSQAGTIGKDTQSELKRVLFQGMHVPQKTANRDLINTKTFKNRRIDLREKGTALF